MNLTETPSQVEFRARLRQWLADNMPAQQPPEALAERHAYLLAWHKRLYAAGWVGLSWPTQFGGQGRDAVAEAIFSEELGRSGAPPGPSLGYIGRPLMEYGTQYQRERYLPRMLASEETWCQGFSEPGAGSDLAALTTRAVESGDNFVVHGQKIWTSYAQFAQYCLLLVRTRSEGPKHAGISALIVDMASAGIAVRPIVQITGDEEFCEVFFDDVTVPKENLVGPLHGGWKIALTTLAYERGPVDIGYVARYQVLLSDLRDELLARGEVSSEVRNLVASASVTIEALRLQCLRSLSARIHGTPPGPESSVDKLLMARAEQLLLDVALRTLGTSTLLESGPWFKDYLYSRAASVYGGTAQIQRTILAERILGLPRSA